MKTAIKSFLICAVLAASTLNASAIKPKYRGFAEAGIAFGPSSPVYDTHLTDNESDGVAVNFATSHGVQLTRSFFVGAGLGVNNIARNGYDDFAQFAIFLDGRWDLNLAKTVSPFVDLRLGFASNFNSEDMNIFKSNSYAVGDNFSSSGKAQQQPCNQFYFQPTVGVRFRLHHHIGLNVGITYFTRKRTDVIADNHIITDIKSWTKNQFGFVVSVDF